MIVSGFPKMSTYSLTTYGYVPSRALGLVDVNETVSNLTHLNESKAFLPPDYFPVLWVRDSCELAMSVKINAE